MQKMVGNVPLYSVVFAAVHSNDEVQHDDAEKRRADDAYLCHERIVVFKPLADVKTEIVKPHARAEEQTSVGGGQNPATLPVAVNDQEGKTKRCKDHHGDDHDLTCGAPD